MGRPQQRASDFGTICDFKLETLLYRMVTEDYFVLSQFTRLADRRMDGRTDSYVDSKSLSLTR